jgi:hypothetical protein
MSKSNLPDIVISDQTLEELQKCASTCPLDISHLDYIKFQQVLVLYSLQQLLKSYGITPQFDLKIGGQDGPTKGNRS